MRSRTGTSPRRLAAFALADADLARRCSRDDLPGRVGPPRRRRRAASISRPSSAPRTGSTRIATTRVTSGDNLWVAGDGRAEIDYGGGQVRLAGDTNLHVARLDDAHPRAVRRAWTRDRPRPRARRGRGGAGRHAEHADRADAPGPLPDRRERRPHDARARRARRRGDGLVRHRHPAGAAGPDGAARGRRARVRRACATASTSTASTPGAPTATAATSARARPPTCRRQMIGYADLDEYGRWETAQEYGALWYPSGRRGRLGAVPLRPLVVGRRLGLDLGGRRTLGLRAVPLRPLGLVGGRWGWAPGGVRRAAGVVAGDGGVVRRLRLVAFGDRTARRSTAGCRSSWGEPYVPWWGGCSRRCWTHYNRPYAVEHGRAAACAAHPLRRTGRPRVGSPPWPARRSRAGVRCTRTSCLFGRRPSRTRLSWRTRRCSTSRRRASFPGRVRRWRRRFPRQRCSRGRCACRRRPRSRGPARALPCRPGRDRAPAAWTRVRPGRSPPRRRPARGPPPAPASPGTWGADGPDRADGGARLRRPGPRSRRPRLRRRLPAQQVSREPRSPRGDARPPAPAAPAPGQGAAPATSMSVPRTAPPVNSAPPAQSVPPAASAPPPQYRPPAASAPPRLPPPGASAPPRAAVPVTPAPFRRQVLSSRGPPPLQRRARGGPGVRAPSAAPPPRCRHPPQPGGVACRSPRRHGYRGDAPATAAMRRAVGQSRDSARHHMRVRAVPRRHRPYACIQRT